MSSYNPGANKNNPLASVYPDHDWHESQTPIPDHFLSDLDQLGALAHGLTADGSYTDRDRDRARILHFIASHPEGTVFPHITSYVLKGVHPDRATWVTDNDSDHRFVIHFLRNLEDKRPNLVENRKTGGTWVCTPTLKLIDLIIQGISQTHSTRQFTYDREFATQILEGTNDLTNTQKDHLADSLKRYINRIDDYRLLFDVYVDDGRSQQKRQMQKSYKTRFNSAGRVKKQIARFNQALDAAAQTSDSAALLTLTSDPGTYTDDSRPNPRSIAVMTESINPNWNRLNQWLKSDPDLIDDTRQPGVPQWRPELDSSNYHFVTGSAAGGHPDGPVSGRPRKKLDYIKVLEFSSRGLPHLHVLVFNPPTRESDGCPWLIDKNELRNQWQNYGQGQIVDIYPLAKRDDLSLENLRDLVPDPDLDLPDDPAKEIIESTRQTISHIYRNEHHNGAEFDVGNRTRGFVDWYRHGDNDLTNEQIETISRSSDIDMVGLEDDIRHKTAGSYLGKYLSATFGELLNLSDRADDSTKFNTSEKSAAWKLACYWATNRKFWSLSDGLRRKIQRDPKLPDEVKRSIRWATKDTLTRLSGCSTSDLDLESDRCQSSLHQTIAYPFVSIDFLGAYHWDDLPARSKTSLNIDRTIPFNERENSLELRSAGDRPPPVAQIFG